MHKKIIITLSALLFLAAFLGYKQTRSQEKTATQEIKAALVETTLAQDCRTFQESLVFPATVTGNQEVTVTAKSSGTIKELHFDLGKNVRENQLLARIDTTGNNLEAGKNDFQSGQIQQLEQAKRIAKESLELAEKNYKKDDSFANRTARDIAKRQYENSEISLNSALDNQLITSPISGTIVSRQVSLGGSVTVGQPLAIISKLEKLKIQFYVDQEQFRYLTLGLPLTLTDNNQKTFPAKITALSPQADSATKKFLIEAMPLEKKDFLSGTILTVSLEVVKKPTNPDSLLLPLSTITVNQNESYLFVQENGLAKKVSVDVEKIGGEIAQVAWKLPLDTPIVVKGNKTLRDGDAITQTN